MLSYVPTLSDDCTYDSSIGEEHESHRKEEKQGQKDNVVNEFFLFEVVGQVSLVRVVVGWVKPGQLYQ